MKPAIILDFQRGIWLDLIKIAVVQNEAELWS